MIDVSVCNALHAVVRAVVMVLLELDGVRWQMELCSLRQLFAIRAKLWLQMRHEREQKQPPAALAMARDLTLGMRRAVSSISRQLFAP
jgi:hypothetical protein